MTLVYLYRIFTMIMKDTINYLPQHERLATVAKAMGHPARVAILATLIKKESCVCGEIVEVLPLAQATVSQHLKELKKAGLVQGEVEGNKVCYCINQNALRDFAMFFSDFIRPLESNPAQNCC